jgi:hypothetical protein
MTFNPMAIFQRDDRYEGVRRINTSVFLWVLLPIVAVPLAYVFGNYFYRPKK